MNKKTIISASILLIGILVAVIGTYFYVQEKNKKLTLNYVISQCEQEDKTYDECKDEESCTITYKSTRYDCYNKNYNQIVKFKEDDKSSQETYAFRVETAEEFGNGGDKFNYEIGRIVIDTVNPNASKCTYNYRGDADWRPCTEKDLIKSLPKISIAKGKVYKGLKPYLTEINKRNTDSYFGSDGDTQYNEDKLQEALEKYEKQLKVLRNTTIKK